MRFIDIVRLRLRSLLRRSHVEEDLSSELSFHLEQQIAENIASGMPPEEARQAAMRTIGSLDLFKEECRDARQTEWGSTLLRDLRYALRTLSQDRGFTTVAVLSLALGIGVNTALFSLVDAVMLKALPVANPEGLVAIDRVNPQGETKDGFSYPLFEEIRDRVPAFSGVFAAMHGVNRVEVQLPGGETVPEAGLRFVSPGYFQTLGVQPVIGRLLTPEDHPRAASDPGVVVSHRFWKGRLNEDPSILGSQISIERHLFTVLGVAPPEFFGEAPGHAPDLWAPAEAMPILSGVSYLGRPNTSWLKVMARLAPGVDEAGARAALQVLHEQLKAEPGRIGASMDEVSGFEVYSGVRGFDDLRRSYSRPLHVLMVIVGMVLLIACANVASLLLARGAQRSREIGIRLALGAKRARVVRQLMTENLCIAFAGGALGALLAVWATRALLLLVSQRPEPLPLNAEVDLRVFLFTACVSILSSILFGLIPAMQSTRVSTSLTVTTTGKPRQRMGRVLVAAQVAMCVLLLAAAGLFMRTLHNLRWQDLGFRPEGLLQVRIDSQAGGYQPHQLPELSERVLSAVRATPGVLSASISYNGYNTGVSRTCCLAIEGHLFREGENRQVPTESVLPGYFETLGLPLLLGRTFTAADFADPPRLVIVNETAARQYFGTASPIGRRIGWGDPPNVGYGIEIAGVVGDLKTGNLRDEMQPILYFPGNSGRVIHVRTGMDPAAASAAIRGAIGEADSNLPVRGVQVVTAVIESSLVIERLMATLASFFGVLALCLTAVGLYGVVDYSVKRRTREIGVRMALGARPAAIVRMVSREVAFLLAAGTLLGVPAALAFNQVLTAMLFGVDPADGMNIAIAAVVLAFTGALAAIVPSRRAASVAPVTALRHE